MDDPATAAVCSLRQNAICFAARRATYPDRVSLSETMTRFFYSSRTRAFTRAFIESSTIAHPRRGTAPAVDGEGIRALYDDAAPLFLLAEPRENPPLDALRPGKASAVQCIDIGGSFVTRSDPLRRLGRFASLSALSLRNCGLLALPPDLAAPPRPLQFLDLSVNYIATLPLKLAWQQIRGLNLSNNAFVDWPAAATPTAAPSLTFLSLAGNAIGNAPDAVSFFKHLRFIDCSDTLITIIPTWLSECPNIRIMRFSGATNCAQFPLRYLVQFAQLRFADVSGVGLYGTTDKVENNITLLVSLGADAAACPTGNYTLIT
jgi:hypothetical protein